MESIRTFEDLECWKAGRQLRIFVSKKVLPLLPKNEQFELATQLKGAARSVSANIAEGFGRFHYRDNYKFCSNARGSLFEVLDHLITASDEGYLEEEYLIEGRSLFESTRRLLSGYMSYLQRSANETSVVREEDSDDDLAWDRRPAQPITHNS